MCVSVSPWTIKSKIWCVVTVVTIAVLVEVASLNGANVCMVKQKYNITKRVKYRAPMSVRTYEWCFNMPPRCSRWSTEMRDLTRLETEERVAEVAICCPGYKMQDVSCIPICPNGKTGHKCSEDCPINKWGPNCVHDCKQCDHGTCSPETGQCVCRDGWQGERCQISMSTTAATPVMKELLTTIKTTIQTIPSTTKSTITTVGLAPDTTTVAIRPTTSIIVTTLTVKNTSPFTSTTETITTNVTPVLTTKWETAHNNNTLDYSHKTTKPVTTETTSSPIKPLSSATPKTNVILSNKETKVNVDTTRKPDTTLRVQPTTLKFKPKEIWIRPAQKGESPILEIKSNANHDHVKHKHITKKELESTTPKTIIVSIIPTSVSYATFKKIALATVPYMAQKNSTTAKSHRHAVEGFTNSMSVQTSTSIPSINKLNTLSLKQISLSTTTNLSYRNVTKSAPTTLAPTKRTAKELGVKSKTNSMSSTFSVNLNSPISLTTISSINTKPTTKHRDVITTKSSKMALKTTTKSDVNQQTESMQINKTETFNKKELSSPKAEYPKERKKFIKNAPGMSNSTKLNVSNVSNTKTNTVTDQPKEDEEVFHILTEPEHITAVMGEKGTDRTSVDLVSVISIAGGVMMAIITVAVIVVMIERCKRPRYEDVRKLNDIRMQVMIDNNDVPPPYVRSIFHTPLPDPPTSEKCHYQPISTLDRNLKQFMRPVVVQTISPIMLENFRGILECHYDHLPRRDHDFGTMPVRGTATSVNYSNELRAQRAYSVTESTIEALKCEAKLDVIDTTTAEPLYAEIPCWRPPSEHAIEVINTNGEAVTEL
ncbi:uncharacterized protein LOC113522895 isoform X2 [Galleria mellonella]|uniref:Uncharacterized protein LOC113522895 isoform X2 n=1 Tax=Galleria mellonella TaxID=7137 RepID=A0A6J3C1C0_GALME|nr:uncharacterized protein LOC113522895 isoform X2 [Galleria mellonella]